jgi:hypothetical protein
LAFLKWVSEVAIDDEWCSYACSLKACVELWGPRFDEGLSLRLKKQWQDRRLKWLEIQHDLLIASRRSEDQE